MPPFHVAFTALSRYDSIASDLEKSEREKHFDDHIDRLVAKKKDNYRRLLEECKEIRLDSSFKDIRKLIKEDPRYTRYSSSDRKCEKAFAIMDRSYPTHVVCDVLLALFTKVAASWSGKSPIESTMWARNTDVGRDHRCGPMCPGHL